MKTDRLIRIAITTSVVAVSLYIYGNISRHVAPSDIGYDESDTEWIATATGWPQIFTSKLEHRSGMASTITSRSTLSSPSAQWWYDNINRICMGIVVLFTLIQCTHVDHAKISVRQIKIRNILFVTTLVCVFLGVGGLKTHGLDGLLFIPISFGITCMITELAFISWHAIILVLNCYLRCRNTTLRLIGLENLSQPLIDL